MKARVTQVGRLRLASVLAVTAMLIGLLLPAGVGATASPASVDGGGSNQSVWSAPRTVYIPETGQSIDGVFLDFWRANNGIGNYGYPITPEVTENGRTVQYYQFARFEYWPEDPNGNVVQLGAIGQELRPKTVLRPTFAGVGVSSPISTANQQITAFAQAWMPLDKAEASETHSDNWRYVPETGHSVQNGFKAFWENTGEASYLGNPLTEEYQLGELRYQIFERGQLAWKADSDPWMVELGPVLAQKYNISTQATAQGDLPAYSEELFVKPGPKPGNGGERWIEISISSQYLWAWEGDEVVLETYVSTGRPGFDTPTGTFYINTKYDIQTMEGTINGEYYNVPDVPNVMYFTNEGHALHGTYWHNNFGTVMSHGCVNLPLDVAAWMYTWASIGTRVVINP